MTWSALFAIGIAQGLFLVSLLFLKENKNWLATRFMIVMLVIMILTNLGYLVIRTDLVNILPQLFAVPFGMMLLFGPLFFFYSRSLLDNNFKWKTIYWLNFIPYLIQLGINFPIFFFSHSDWQWFISTFFAGGLVIPLREKIIFAIQVLHLSIYLVMTIRLLKKEPFQIENAGFVIPLRSRVRWLQSLVICFAGFLLCVASAYIYLLFRGTYYPLTNYIYTLASSCIIYFIGYNLVLNPELISADFSRKYKSQFSLKAMDTEDCIGKLQQLMTREKIFTNPDLKLPLLAGAVGVTPHQLSRLINEKFGKSFNEFINEFRVTEFLERINDVSNSNLTIYGIALDVGFNSKSSFNTSFKKITGKTPSEYKSA